MTGEHALLKRAQAYDEQAIAQLYDQYAPRVYAYLYRRLQDAQLAEDLTGEVFVRLLEALQSEQFWHTSFRAWLYRVAHNLVVDVYRRRAVGTTLPLDDRPSLANSEEPPETVVEQREALDCLRKAVKQLTPEQQQVLVLRFGERLKAKEVAEIMNKSVGAVEALQHRALAALRRLCKDGDR